MHIFLGYEIINAFFVKMRIISTNNLHNLSLLYNEKNL